METRRRFVFEEVVENADDKVLARLKFVDRSGFVEEWVPLDQVSGLEPGARIELIEDDAGMSPHIVRVDRGPSPVPHLRTHCARRCGSLMSVGEPGKYGLRRAPHRVRGESVPAAVLVGMQRRGPLSSWAHERGLGESAVLPKQVRIALQACRQSSDPEA